MSQGTAQHEDAHPICDYEGSTYRTDFWEGRGREYEDRAERLALQKLLPPRGRRLLDIGAGFGRLASLYDSYEQVILLDYSRSQLEYARENLGDERFIYVAADIYRLPLATDTVDTTVMVRVLHHLADVPHALEHIARISRPRGAFVLEFANKRHLKNLLARLIGRGPNPFARDPFEFAPLHYDFHPAWVVERLREAGFEVDARLSVSLLRQGMFKRIFPVAWLVMVEGMLQRMTAPLALGPSVFLRSRATKPGNPAWKESVALFRCLECGHEPLDREAAGMRCSRCEARWPIENGIHIFK